MSKWETVDDVCERWRERYERKGFNCDPPQNLNIVQDIGTCVGETRPGRRPREVCYAW
jgi:hypothetical protein